MRYLVGSNVNIARIRHRGGLFYAAFARLGILTQSRTALLHQLGTRTERPWKRRTSPQVVEQKYADSIERVSKRLDFLSASDRAWLLRRTTERFFFPK